MSQLQQFASSPVKVSTVIGTSVVNPQGSSLGDIKEVVIDPRIGKAAYALGVLTMNQAVITRAHDWRDSMALIVGLVNSGWAS